MMTIRTAARDTVANALKRTGYEVRRPITKRDGSLSRSTVSIVDQVSSFTMTSPERVLAAIDAVHYVERNNIPGDIVECGVWAGGVSMAMAKSLNELGSQARTLWLYDTFEGMSAPTASDVDRDGVTAAETMASMSDPWCFASEADVRSNIGTTTYPTENVRMVRGKVEETIPGVIPDQIAILRLDTDWYESTRHELKHLIPRVRDGGVLLIDDYGYWDGARKAVDEWLETCGFPVLLARTDYSGRMAVINRK